MPRRPIKTWWKLSTEMLYSFEHSFEGKQSPVQAFPWDSPSCSFLARYGEGKLIDESMQYIVSMSHCDKTILGLSVLRMHYVVADSLQQLYDHQQWLGGHRSWDLPQVRSESTRCTWRVTLEIGLFIQREKTSKHVYIVVVLRNSQNNIKVPQIRYFGKSMCS